MNSIFKMQQVEKLNSYDYEITDQRIKLACDYADVLENYCVKNFSDSNEQKKIIEQFIDTGSFEVFPENDNIRNNIRDNFTLELFKDVIWTLIVRVLGDTYDKYGSLQFEGAIASLMYDDSDDFKLLTNERENRSYLCKLASKSIIKKLLQEKVLQHSKTYTIDSMVNIISEEIEKSKKKSDSRKQ